jgi:hypothetical protein
MTSSDRAIRQPSLWVSCGIIIGTAFVGGAVAGFTDAMAERGEATISGGLGFGLVTLIGAAVLALYLSRFGRFWAAWSRRKRLYTVSLALSVALGLIISIGLRSASGDAGAFDPFGNRPIAPTPAIILSGLWAIILGVAIALYQHTIDEHEKQAYLSAGTAAFNVIAIVAPVWWLMWRAGQAPPTDGLALFVLAAIVNAIVYLWIKYR